MSEAAPVVVAVAPNGARKTKSDHPRLPLSPEELAQCAQDCAAAGAAMLHLHVRDAEGRHSLDPGDYRRAIGAIRARVGDALVLQVTSEAAGRYAPGEQMAAIATVEPEAVSLATRELCPERGDTLALQRFLAALHARGAFVQYIVYDAQDIRRTVALHEARIVPQRRPHLLLVLGSYGVHPQACAPGALRPPPRGGDEQLGAALRCSSVQRRPGTPRDLLPLLAAMPNDWPWSVCAFGADEARCVAAAALLGGQVRVGFENNTALPSGETARDNAALVRVTVDTLRALCMRAATPEEARELFRTSCD